MNPFRVALLLILGCSLLNISPASAQGLMTPFAPNAQFSADMEITTNKGQAMTQKIFSDGGKVRSEMNANGMQMISIVRPDEKKVYSVMTAQKMIMEMPYDADKFKQMAPGAGAAQGTFDKVGPDSVDGVACTKYKTTSADGKVFFYWIDGAKTPVKMAAEDGSFIIRWKNYKAGPQDAALFEPPTGYQVMPIPAAAGGDDK